MSKDVAIIVLGIWIAIVPFLGFPGFWETIIYVASGLGVVLMTFLLRRDIILYVSRITDRQRKSTDVYVENRADNIEQTDTKDDLPKHTKSEKISQ
ncbi:hypothetical protein IIB50_03060 [Patescibacteria group bacterium]|nr:hypothetical protein [Patescibacteria group bacterium]